MATKRIGEAFFPEEGSYPLLINRDLVGQLSILVTGGSGFIGSNICRRLVEPKNDVVAYDNTLRQLGIFRSIKDKMEMIRGDFLDLSDLIATTGKYDVDGIIHTCALLAETALEKIYPTFRVNVEGTINVLEVARLIDVDRVVYTSTGAIYGYEGREDLRPLKENEPSNPRGTYAVTKYMGESWRAKTMPMYMGRCSSIAIGSDIWP